MSRTFFYNDSQPGSHSLSLHAPGKAVEGFARTPLPNGRGAGVRAPAAGQKAQQAPPRRAIPHPVALRATRPLPFGLADSHKAGAQFPSPLVGEDRLGRRPSEEGGAGHMAPGRSRPPVASAAGARPT